MVGDQAINSNSRLPTSVGPEEARAKRIKMATVAAHGNAADATVGTGANRDFAVSAARKNQAAVTGTAGKVDAVQILPGAGRAELSDTDHSILLCEMYGIKFTTFCDAAKLQSTGQLQFPKGLTQVCSNSNQHLF